MSARFALLLLLAAAASGTRGQDQDVRAPFITTPAEVVERMLRFAATGPADLVVDLGSGDGRIVIDAARKFGARGHGIELDPVLVEKSRDSVRLAGLSDRVSIVHGDVLREDISQASVVTIYLLPSLIGRLQPRFIDELRPGTRIVSHAFYMPSWKPDRAETMRIARRHEGQGDESKIYLWIVPAKARGVWDGGEQGSRWKLRIHQNFQEIEVEAQLNGRPVEVKRASLSGSEIAWEADGARFRGSVQGDSIAGELAGERGGVPLSLKRAR
jgi:protein-L-isoaspartate O-methyltransferase